MWTFYLRKCPNCFHFDHRELGIPDLLSLELLYKSR